MSSSRPQGLDQRFDARSAARLEQVLHTAMTQLVAADPVAVPLIQRFTGVVIQDATTITLPNDFAARWPSCGDRTATTPTAALKCGVQLDLLTGALYPLALASGRTQDQALAFAAAPLAPGTVRIAGLGFFNFDAFATLTAQGNYWLSRARVNMILTDADGRRLALLAFVQQHRRRGAGPAGPGRSPWPVVGCACAAGSGRPTPPAAGAERRRTTRKPGRVARLRRF